MMEQTARLLQIAITESARELIPSVREYVVMVSKPLMNNVILVRILPVVLLAVSPLQQFNAGLQQDNAIQPSFVLEIVELALQMFTQLLFAAQLHLFVMWLKVAMRRISLTVPLIK